MATKTVFTIKVLDRVRKVYVDEIDKIEKRIRKWSTALSNARIGVSSQLEEDELEYELREAMDAKEINNRKLAAIQVVIHEEHILDTLVNIPIEELLPTLTA